MAMHVGQPALDAVVIERQPRVVDAQQVQDRGVEVVDIDRLLGHLPADVVGRSVSDAVLEAGSGQPDAEGVRVVIAASTHFTVPTFGIGRAAELGVEDHQRVVGHPALTQSAHQRGDRLVDLVGLVAMVVRDAAANSSSSFGVGGSPMRSNVTRRVRVQRSA